MKVFIDFVALCLLIFYIWVWWRVLSYGWNRPAWLSYAIDSAKPRVFWVPVLSVGWIAYRCLS